jgi:hypothetical protein
MEESAPAAVGPKKRGSAVPQRDPALAEAPTGTTTPAARAIDLVKVYGRGDAAVRALDGVTVEFGRGEFTAVMGPSAWPHTAAKLRDDFSGVPVDDTAELLGLTAARVYGFDLDELRPIARKIGPTPESLGQDATLRSDPAERAGARWWKAEYGVQSPN